MARMYVRRCWTSHSRDGFELAVWDLWLPFWAAEKATETLLAVLGHPCCGRGLGRIPGVDIAAYRLLNAPNRWWRHNRQVIRLPITREQALIIQPDWAEEKWTEDDWTSEDETAAILADPETMEAIREGDAAVAAGDVLPSEELDRLIARRRAPSWWRDFWTSMAGEAGR